MIEQGGRYLLRDLARQVAGIAALPVQAERRRLWKPHPAHLVGDFDEESIRVYIRLTVEAARAHGCVLEMILEDTHTCDHRPERFDRWTQIARQEVDRLYTRAVVCGTHDRDPPLT